MDGGSRAPSSNEGHAGPQPTTRDEVMNKHPKGATYFGEAVSPDFCPPFSVAALRLRRRMVLLTLPPAIVPGAERRRNVVRAHWPAQPNWQPAHPKKSPLKPRVSKLNAAWSDGHLCSSYTGAPKTTAQLAQYGDCQLLSAESEKRIGLLHVLPENASPSARLPISPPSAPRSLVERGSWGAACEQPRVARGCIARPPSNIGLTSSPERLHRAQPTPQRDAPLSLPILPAEMLPEPVAPAMERGDRASSSHSTAPGAAAAAVHAPACTAAGAASAVCAAATCGATHPGGVASGVLGPTHESAAAGLAVGEDVLARRAALPPRQNSAPSTTFSAGLSSVVSSHPGAMLLGSSPPLRASTAYPSFAARQQAWARTPQASAIVAQRLQMPRTPSVDAIAAVGYKSAKLLAQSRAASAAVLRTARSSSPEGRRPRSQAASRARARAELPPAPDKVWVALGITPSGDDDDVANAVTPLSGADSAPPRTPSPPRHAQLEFHVMAPRLHIPTDDEEEAALTAAGGASVAGASRPSSSGLLDDDDSSDAPRAAHRKVASRRRATASLAIMEDRARPITWTGGRNGRKSKE